jgi:hypothetical protein
MDKELQFKNVLKSFGVTKCYLSKEFDFNDKYPCGKIYVDVDSNDLDIEIYKLFTDDGWLDEEQSLLVGVNNFINIEPNYSLED